MTTRILGFSGSFRQGSLNTALLETLGDLMPDDVAFSVYDYRDVPLYNSDLGEPDSVVRLKQAIADADALLFATPEYNHSIPGVLKNAIDWASRPAYAGPLTGKRAAMVSASASFVGGARAQMHLQNILLGMGVQVLPNRDVLVGSAHQRVEDGRITDAMTLRFLREFVDEFVPWARG